VAQGVLRGLCPTSATPCHTPPQHRPPQRQDPPMPPTPTATYERLREYIDKRKRIRMSHIYQPLMLMELLGHGFARQQPAPPLRRTWLAGSWGKT
jgi:hypothetical protein